MKLIYKKGSEKGREEEEEKERTESKKVSEMKR